MASNQKARTAATELKSLAEAAAAEMATLLDAISDVQTFDHLDVVAEMANRAAAAGNEVADAIVAATVKWNVKTVEDVDKLLAEKQGSRFVRVVVKGVSSLHAIDEIVAKLDLTADLSWDLKNADKLRHLQVIARAIQAVLKAIPPSDSIIPASTSKKLPFPFSLPSRPWVKQNETLLRDAIQTIKRNARQTGHGFWDRADEVAKYLQDFADAPHTKSSIIDALIDLRQHLVDILDLDVDFESSVWE